MACYCLVVVLNFRLTNQKLTRISIIQRNISRFPIYPMNTGPITRYLKLCNEHFSMSNFDHMIIVVSEVVSFQLYLAKSCHGNHSLSLVYRVIDLWTTPNHWFCRGGEGRVVHRTDPSLFSLAAARLLLLPLHRSALAKAWCIKFLDSLAFKLRRVR